VLSASLYPFVYSDTISIEAYRPGSVDEARIIELIKTFHKAGQVRDLKTYLSCLSPKGRFMFSGGLMVSKEQLRLLLPEFWTDLENNASLTRAASRESMNGNFLRGSLYDPRVSVQGLRAGASLTFSDDKTGWKTVLFMEFENQDQEWKILRFEWDMG